MFLCPIITMLTLAQMKAWHRTATSHHLNQCWPSLLPYICVTQPQWVSSSIAESGIFRDSWADTMSVCVARAPAAIMYDKPLLLFHVEGYQLPAPAQCR